MEVSIWRVPQINSTPILEMSQLCLREANDGFRNTKLVGFKCKVDFLIHTFLFVYIILLLVDLLESGAPPCCTCSAHEVECRNICLLCPLPLKRNRDVRLTCLQHSQRKSSLEFHVSPLLVSRASFKNWMWDVK